MLEFENGKRCAIEGHSIHYNPYRHKGTQEQYHNWIKGWLFETENSAKQP